MDKQMRCEKCTCTELEHIVIDSEWLALRDVFRDVIRTSLDLVAIMEHNTPQHERTKT